MKLLRRLPPKKLLVSFSHSLLYTKAINRYSASAIPGPSSSTKPEDKEKSKAEPVTAKEHLDVAADLMSDLQVETYSSMDKREKTELCVQTKASKGENLLIIY